MMEQKLKWCPRCGTIVQSNRKATRMAVVGIVVILANLVEIPIYLALVPRTPMNMAVVGYTVIGNVLIGAFFIWKGGLYRCSVCNAPTPKDHPPAGPTDFTHLP